MQEQENSRKRSVTQEQEKLCYERTGKEQEKKQRSTRAGKSVLGKNRKRAGKET